MPMGRVGDWETAVLGWEGARRDFARAISWGQAGGTYSAGPEDGVLQPGRAERVPLTDSVSNGAILHSWVSD